jgi:predicted RNA-binding Zn-ribbon protein involved in translation (DUF1610 family)
MYDVLRASYRFHCPNRGEGELARVPLSAFRRIERLPGAVHPAVYRVEYDCACGTVHPGLVSHSDLDYGPLAPVEVEFRNLITGRTEPVGAELAEVARSQVQRGNWPWRLYCSREGRLKPVFPSCLAVVLPHGHGDLVGVAMNCPSCGQTTLNLVSEPHLDVPFFHDRIVHYVERPFGDVRDLTLEQFRSRLHSARFDAARSDLSDAA